MNDLKLRIRKSGMTLKEVAARCDLSYVRLDQYLNDFAPMPEHIKTKIEEVLKENE